MTRSVDGAPSEEAKPESRSGSRPLQILFWAAWSIAAAVTAGAVAFFVAGVADGSVSSFNIVLWTVLLSGVVGVTGGSLWLRKAGHPVLATLLAMFLGVPGLLAALLLLVVLISHPRWN